MEPRVRKLIIALDRLEGTDSSIYLRDMVMTLMQMERMLLWAAVSPSFLALVLLIW